MSQTLLTCVLLAILVSAHTNEVITSYVSSTYDWDSRSSSVSATCVKIPRNLTLCSSMDYDKMRLPNLLEHDTLSEVSQQAASWVPLLNVRCHPDTQRFICSLFCPVCLDHPIYPCRSLCEKVKAGCEVRMKMYGFPWPDMFACSQFPVDNDMCIRSQSTSDSSSEEKCRICEQINTVENILDHYCQSSFAMRGKLKNIQGNQLTFKMTKLFKGKNETRKDFHNELFYLNLTEECCRDKLKIHSSYFIMGVYKDKSPNTTFIMPWVVKRSKSFKKSIRMLKRINCSNPATITHKVIDPTLAVIANPVKIESKHSGETPKRRGRKKNKNHKTLTLPEKY